MTLRAVRRRCSRLSYLEEVCTARGHNRLDSGPFCHRRQLESAIRPAPEEIWASTALNPVSVGASVSREPIATAARVTGAIGLRVVRHECRERRTKVYSRGEASYAIFNPSSNLNLGCR